MDNQFFSRGFSGWGRAFSARRAAILAVCLFCGAAWLTGGASLARAADQDPAATRLAAARQLLVVTGEGWDAPGGVLRLFERDEAGGAWRPAGEPVLVVLGKKGLAWGRGLHSVPAGAVQKREGDGRAPAGVFELGEAFGYAPKDELPPIRLDYRQAVDSLKCVDDSASSHYNAILDQATVTPDWQSVEDMRRQDDLYRYGLFVRHNSPDPLPGGGSCIFIHVWRGEGQGTAGCTAMAEARVASLLTWLDPAKRPLLVQFPVQMLDEARARWNLPLF